MLLPRPKNYHEAVAIQENLRAHVRPRGRIAWRSLHTVAGADCSFARRAREGVGGIVVFEFPSLVPIAESFAVAPAEFPYIPGLLSFREIPLLVAAWEKLTVRPQVIICDAQGIAHPRGIGLASHLGLVLEVPTVGCAKTRLVGEYREPPLERGAKSDLMYDGRKVGFVLRTRTATRPLFVSPGHRVGPGASAELVLRCSSRYRLPEVIRAAHHLVNRIRKEKNVR